MMIFLTTRRVNAAKINSGGGHPTVLGGTKKFAETTIALGVLLQRKIRNDDHVSPDPRTLFAVDFINHKQISAIA